MRSAEVTVGRRIVLVLEPGEEVVAAVTEACRQHGVRQGLVPVLSGAFRSVTMIAAHTPVEDEEPPLPQEVTVPYTEGIGSGTVQWDPQAGAAAVHLHVAVGVKNTGATGFAGHLLQAEVHYTTEVLVEEVLSPALLRLPDPAAHGITTLHLGQDGADVGC